MQVSAHASKDRQYHDAIADEYHRLVVDPRKMANDILFRPLLPMQNIRSYLDLGCGTGHMLDRVCSELKPERVTAVDHSEGMLREARRVKSLASASAVEFRHSDLLEFLESADQTYDLISCVGVLHHLRLPAVKRVLELCRTSLSSDRGGGTCSLPNPSMQLP